MQDWKSIDEAPASEPIVLRGIPVTVPRAYDRPRRTHPLSIASVAAALWRVSSWSASLLGHLILGIVLVGLIASKPAQKELPAQFHLWKGNQGEHGKSLAEARSDIPEEPQPVTKADPEPERVREAPLTPSVEQPIPLRSPEEPEPLKPAAETAKKEEGSDSTGKGSGSPAPAKTESKDPGGLIEKDPTSATAVRRAGDLAKLRRGGSAEIVVASGSYDHVEKVLETLAIPHTRIEHSDLAGYDLTHCRVLLVNCDGVLNRSSFSSGGAEKMEQESQRLAKAIAEKERRLEEARKSNQRLRIREWESDLAGLRESKKQHDRLAEYYRDAARLVVHIRKFVEGGGFLFTSDWGLSLLEKAFPDFVANGGEYGDRSVTIVPRNSTEEKKLLEDVFVKPGRTQSSREWKWEVDSGSYLVRVKSNRVKVLVESRQIPGHRAVAVVFAPTDASGRVLHVLSHFAKQEDHYGEYALQNLLLNFILERTGR